MRCSLASDTIDPLGHVWIDPNADTDLGTPTRRVSRVATLDGGVAVNDFGYAPGDMTITLRWTPDETIDARVERMLKVHQHLICCTERGAYLCAPDAIRRQARATSISLLVLEQRSEQVI